MLLTKKVLTVRISGKERKQKVRNFLYDLAHFRNLLLIFIEKYKFFYQKFLLHEPLLYVLLSRNYKGKYQKEVKEIFKNIENNEKLDNLAKLLKEQKEKISNTSFIQVAIRQVIKDFKSYFNSLKKFKKDPLKFFTQPRPSKPKKLKYLLNFSAEANVNTFKKEKDNIIIRLRNKQYLKVKLPKNFPYRISSVRLKFFGDDLFVDLVYEVIKNETKEPKGNLIAGIDLGLNELLSVVSSNPELKSFIISGKEIKAFNQWFNKEKAKLQSKIDKAKNENEKEKVKELEIRSKVLSSYRKRWIEDKFHRISRRIVDLLYQTGHKTIYIGKNALESKNGINIGRKNNQHFVSIPFRRSIKMIKYKAQDLEMKVIEVNESYTSKTSPFADILKVQETKDRRFA